MNHPHATDFAALGLRDHSPFAILERPRAPLQPSPQPNRQGTNSSPLRGTPRNSAPAFNVPIAGKAESGKTARIKGKTL